MRPLRLEIEGFTAFREKQTIDFSDIDLFAISGPTGAGKTSVLDAMQWALFGRVPRMSQQLNQLISLGSDTAAVVFNFELRGKTYQVARRMKRTGNTQAQFDQIEPEAVPLASGVRLVDAKVVEVIGLGADTFAMAVVLPQGKFARYFEASPGDRRTLMRDIYGLGIFEEMRGRATRLAGEASARATTLAGIIDAQGVSSELIAALEREWAEATDALPVAESQAGSLRHGVAEQREVLRLQEELRAARVNLESVLGARAKYDADLLVLERGARAEQVGVELERLQAAQRDVNEALSEESRLREEGEVLSGELKGATERAERARHAELELPQLEAKAQALREAEERLRTLEQWRARLNRVDEEIRGVLKGRDASAAEQARARDELESLKTVIEDARAELQRHVSRMPRLTFLAELKGQAQAWEAHEAARTLSATQIAGLKGRLDASQNELEAAQARLLTHKAARQAALEVATQARDAFESAKHRNIAQALRAHLHEGDACPVCEQTVSVVPATHDEAFSAEERAFAQAEAVLLSCTEQWRDAERAVDFCERERARLAAEVETATSDLEAALTAATASCGGFLEAFGADGLAAFHQDLQQHEAWADDADKLEIRLEGQVQQLKALETSIDGTQARLVEWRRRGEALEQERAETEQALKGVASALPERLPEDVAGELEALTSRVAEVRRGVLDAEKRVAEVQASLRANQARLGETVAMLTKRQRTLSAAQDAVDAKLENLGFGSVDDARAARIDEQTRGQLVASTQAFASSRVRLEQTVETLVDKIGPRSASTDQAEALEGELKRAENACKELYAKIAALDARREDAKRRLETVRTHETELEVVRARHRTMNVLADDLRTNNFQNFVFQDLFTELVEGASTRLLALSQRYTLAVDEETKFFVVDRDNANQQRAIETLSGGETFLASLALALELSEQVQRAAGAVSLDSLFIDEGFGTLDPETLDTVAEAVEALRDTGRVVGIITHIAELTNRLPVRLRVNKALEGSHIVIDRD